MLIVDAFFFVLNISLDRAVIITNDISVKLFLRKVVCLPDSFLVVVMRSIETIIRMERICKCVTHSDVNKSICRRQTN